MEVSLKRSFSKYGKAAGSLLCAGALAFSMTVGSAAPAFATDAQGGKSVSNTLSCSPTPMLAGSVDLLGLSVLDERWGIDEGNLGIGDEGLDNGSGALRYLLMGTDKYNENPNPYMFNSLYDTNGQKVLADSTRSNGDYFMNPNRALAYYKAGFDADDAIWEMKPDVIFGTGIKKGDNSESAQTDYSAEVADAKQKNPELFKDYDPVGVWVNTSLPTMVDLFYHFAEGADEAAAKTTSKSLRYGPAIYLARNYEAVVKGSQGYVLSKLAENNADQKTVAYVTKTEDGNVTLSGSFGTTASALVNVAENYAADMQLNEDGQVTMPATDLVDAVKNGAVDLVVLASNDAAKKTATTAGLEEIYNKIYWSIDADCGTMGSDKQALDTACNYGRLLGALYPEYVDQSDMVAYYYDTVYHVKADMVGKAVDQAMDGVRNWDVQSGSDASDYLQWTESTVADYNKAEVQNLLITGLNYLDQHKDDSDMAEELALTSSVSDLEDALKNHTNDVANTSEDLPAETPGDQPGTETPGDQPGTETPGDKPGTETPGDQPGTETPGDEPGTDQPAAETTSMTRLYNQYTGEHLFTADANEVKTLVSLGWTDEGEGWKAPNEGTEVYRLYNPNTGEHHYTTDKNEYNVLQPLGWNGEGVFFHSADKDSGVAVYRLFNPFAEAFTHHYTTDANEYKTLQTIGWNDENIGWYGLK